MALITAPGWAEWFCSHLKILHFRLFFKENVNCKKNTPPASLSFIFPSCSLLYSLCSKLQIQTEMDSAYFLETLAGNFMDVVQYNEDNRAFEVRRADTHSLTDVTPHQQSMCDTTAGTICNCQNGSFIFPCVTIQNKWLHFLINDDIVSAQESRRNVHVGRDKTDLSLKRYRIFRSISCTSAKTNMWNCIF